MTECFTSICSKRVTILKTLVVSGVIKKINMTHSSAVRVPEDFCGCYDDYDDVKDICRQLRKTSADAAVSS